MSNIRRHGAGSVTAGQKSGGQFASHERGLAGAPLPLGARDQPAGRPAWAEHQVRRELRGHDFYPSAGQIELIPDLYDTDGTTVGAGGKIIHAKYFGPTGRFYVAEIDKESGEAFGVFENNYGETEMTYFSVPHAEQDIAYTPLPAIWERELDFSPQRMSGVLPEKFAGREVERLSREQFNELEVPYRKLAEHKEQAHAPDFDVEGLEQHMLEAQNLEMSFHKKCERYGIFISTTDLNVPMRAAQSHARSGWVDEELAGVQIDAREAAGEEA